MEYTYDRNTTLDKNYCPEYLLPVYYCPLGHKTCTVYNVTHGYMCSHALVLYRNTYNSPKKKIKKKKRK